MESSFPSLRLAGDNACFFPLVLLGRGGGVLMKYGADKGVLAGFPVLSSADRCTAELHPQAS